MINSAIDSTNSDTYLFSFQEISPQLHLIKGISVGDMDACLITSTKNINATLISHSEGTFEGGKRNPRQDEIAGDAVISDRVRCVMLYDTPVRRTKALRAAESSCRVCEMNENM